MSVDVNLINAEKWIDVLFERKIKIAVIGSCYSRVCMMTHPYFGINYKKIIDLGKISYHQSILSFMSKPFNIAKEDFKTPNPGFQNSYDAFAGYELNKNFFEELKEYKPDYVIIDNYADANCKVFEMSGNRYLTKSYFINGTGIIERLKPRKELEIDSEERLALYDRYLPEFMNILLKIVPEKNIILNMGRKSLKRLNEKNELVDWDDISFSLRANKVWELLDDKIKNSYKDVRIVDMTHTQYVSPPEFPFGNSSSHYPKEYYQEQWLKYNDIFIEDYVKRDIWPK